MPQYGTWVGYGGGTARIVLAVVMVAAAEAWRMQESCCLSRSGQQGPARQRRPSCW